MAIVIGIVGFMDSGKGTVGNILADKYGFATESFAKPLKDAAAPIFGWDREMLEGVTKESREWRERIDPYWADALDIPNFTPRLALQLLGTEAGRNVFGESLWTASCFRRCNELTNMGVSVVITDVRFRNEVASVKEYGKIIRVKRGPEPSWVQDVILNMQDDDEYYSGHFPDDPDKVQRYVRDGLVHYMEESGLDIHQSEWDWIGCEFDYTIENDGTLAELYQKVHDILIDLKVVEMPLESTKIHSER